MKKTIHLLISVLLAMSLCCPLTSCYTDSIPSDNTSGNSTSDTGNSGSDSGENSGENSGSDTNSGSDSGSQSSNLETYWYKGTTFYHIWIKSFNDSNNDGIGDINGIKNKLDYISETLGCDGIWLSPVFECAGKGEYMHGYDTTDYYAVNDKFGTSEDLAALINACHEKGIKIIFDFVPNHTSTSSPWFTRSAAKQTVNGVDYTDWYVWNSSKISASTNMSSSQYYSNSTRGQYYYGAFGGDMPDLNYANSAVRAEMLKVIKYWMDFGFDGMRVDAVRYLYDDVSSSSYMDGTKSHEVFAEWRQLLDSYKETSPKFMMCEAWIEDSDRSILETYLGTDASPEFNMVLDFNQGRPCYTSVSENKDNFNFGTTFKANTASGKTGAGYASFLTNHDEYTSRIGTVFNGDEAAISQATTLSLMRANVPVIYYGQEIGMKNTSSSGDAALRGAFDWTEEASQAASTTSILSLNKALLTVRKTYQTLFADGTITKLTSSDNTKLAYTITDSNTKILCVYNFSESGAETASFTESGLGTVAAYSTLIGDDDDSELTVSGGAVTVTKLSPYSYRVYLIGDSSKSNLFDSETYSDSHEINYRTYYDNMYLRGSMNSWGATEMTADENHSIFTVSTSLSAGTYNFKFCTTNSSWSGKAWGSMNGLTYGTDTVFNATGSENFTVNVSSAGTYTFKFDSYYGIVTVLSSGSTEDAAKENVVYLRGGFSGWEENEGIAMEKKSSSVYSVTFTPTAGTYEFKITKDNNSWDTQWGSASSATMTAGTAAATSSSSSSANFKITLAATATTITLNTAENTVTVSQ